MLWLQFFVVSWQVTLWPCVSRWVCVAYGIAKWHVCSSPAGGVYALRPSFSLLRWRWRTERSGWAAWPSGLKGQRVQPVSVDVKQNTNKICRSKFKPAPPSSSWPQQPYLSPTEPMRRALKKAQPIPHPSPSLLKRHVKTNISRFKKRTTQSAVHNDDAGSLGSDNPCLRVHRTPTCSFWDGWEIKFRDTIIFRDGGLIFQRWARGSKYKIRSSMLW